MNEDTIEEEKSSSSAVPASAKEVRKSKYRSLYQKSVDVAEVTHQISENSPENDIKTLEHQRRILAKQVGSLLIQQEKQHEQRLDQAVKDGEVDTLTRIYNLAGFNRRLVEEKARIERAAVSGGNTNSMLIYFDANKLKLINDGEGGHEAGNKYLQDIALAISESARPTDVAARIGGDEFALLVPTASPLDVKEELWERLRSAFINRGLSVSAGAAPFEPDDIDLSKKRADRAMYKAKRFSRIYGTNELIMHGENIR